MTAQTTERRPGDRIRQQQANGKKPPATALIAAVVGLGGALALAVYSANKVIAYGAFALVALYVVSYAVDRFRKPKA